MLIDSHAHLTFPELKTPLEALLQRAQGAGIKKIINICTQPQELEEGLALSQRFPWIYNVGCTTPHDVEEDGERCFSYFEQKAPQLVAIGETGLDYYYEHADRDLQKHFLKKYLDLAQAHHLPVVIHCREAFADFFKILDSQNFKGKGVLHCFTGTLEEAQEVIERGWFLSLSGIVTFKKSHDLREVARTVPLEQLLIETDTPYLAPTPYRGKVNEPAYLIETAKCLSEVKGVSLEKLSHQTSQNALALFGISD